LASFPSRSQPTISSKESKKERFNIVAKTGEPVPSKDEMLPLLQPLLADRFGLSLHREMKNLPGYILTVAKGGPKMEVSEADAPVPFKKAVRSGGSRINAPRLTMAELAETLSRRLGSPVRDMTELAGAYRVVLEWSREDKEAQKIAKGKPGKDAVDKGKDLPSIFTAIQQQLGLKLESRKTPAELFVIDHVERAPTEN
jgi:uncharacterized protein (TIGR03435 family)